MISGSKSNRPGLDLLIEFARSGDTIVIWRLDRLGRSLKDLIELVGRFENQGLHLRSLNEQIDTTNSTGKLLFHLFAAMAEFERNLIRERTLAGLAAARKRGKSGGRPSALSAQQVREIRALLAEPAIKVADITARYGISRATLYRYASRKAGAGST